MRNGKQMLGIPQVKSSSNANISLRRGEAWTVGDLRQGNGNREALLPRVLTEEQPHGSRASRRSLIHAPVVDLPTLADSSPRFSTYLLTDVLNDRHSNVGTNNVGVFSGLVLHSISFDLSSYGVHTIFRGEM